MVGENRELGMFLQNDRVLVQTFPAPCVKIRDTSPLLPSADTYEYGLLACILFRVNNDSTGRGSKRSQ